MSRSGYSDDCDNDWSLIMWRGAVTSAIRGRRGQALLRELLETLDAMSAKRLITDALVADGEVCALGSVGLKRDLPMAGVDPDDYVAVANLFAVAPALVQEIEFVNDDAWFSHRETPEQRWVRVRAWVAGQIKAPGHD